MRKVESELLRRGASVIELHLISAFSMHSAVPAYDIRAGAGVA